MSKLCTGQAEPALVFVNQANLSSSIVNHTVNNLSTGKRTEISGYAQSYPHYPQEYKRLIDAPLCMLWMKSVDKDDYEYV